MDQKRILTQALGFLRARRWRRRWTRLVTALSALVVFVTAYLLILPAVTLTGGSFAVTARAAGALPEGAYPIGQAAETEIFAEADGGRAETVFVLLADGDNAGLDESRIAFDGGGTAAVPAQDGGSVELHREYTQSGEARYWFALAQGQSVRFSLPWGNGTDRYRAEVTEERIPLPGASPLPTEEPPAETEMPEETEAPEMQPPETEDAPEETPPEETAEDTPLPEPTPEPGPSESGEEQPDDSPAPHAQELPADTAAPTQAPDAPASAGDAAESEPTAEPGEETPAESTAADDGSAVFAAANGSGVPRLAGGTALSLSSHAVPIWTRAFAAAFAPSAVPEPGTDGEPTLGGEPAGYETVLRTEIVLAERGDPDAPGSLTLRFGRGASLEEAAARADGELRLSWAEPAAPETPPEGAASWATVDKPGFAPANAVLLLADGAPADAGDPRGSHDFGPNITGVIVETLQNGQWVSGTEFFDGTNVRVQIFYSLPEGVVGAANKTIHYDMPEGITLAQAENGLVSDNGVTVGSYTISREGYIEITFSDAFADGRAFTGQIQFKGTVWAKDDGGDNEISFGGEGGTTITVKPNPAPTDVRVDKTGSYDETDKKLHYTLTVSTTKGTGGPITVKDSFGVTNTHAVYDKNSFQIVKVEANGQETPVPGFTPTITDDGWDGAPEKFTIANLPALSPGESYKITYTAAPGESSDKLGASNVSNTVSVTTEGGSSGSDSVNIDISHQMLSKTGSYDQAAGVIRWTITLNPDKRDIGGWTLTDTITAPDGVTVTMPKKVNISPAVGGQTEITLPYTFPEGASDAYTITYETPVEGLEPGQTATVTNKAKFEGDEEHYETSADTYPSMPDYSVGKSVWHDTNQSTETTGIYRWNANITVPAAFGANDLGNIAFTDTLHDLTANGETIPGSHFFTGAQLDAMTVNVDGQALTRGTDYTVTSVGEADKYTGFKVEFTESAVEKVKGKTIALQYSSTVDYTGLEPETAYTVRNTAAIPDHEANAETSYTPPKPPQKLEKQVSNSQNGPWTDGISMDYSASGAGGVLHYRLLLRTDETTKGDITVTDRLPAGAALVDDSEHLRFYYSDYHEEEAISWWDGDGRQHTYTGAENLTVTPALGADGTTALTFTIQDGYNRDGKHNTLAIYYDVSIAEDPRWTDDPGLESHVYRNQAAWGDAQAGVDVTVERDVPEIAKTGAQLPQLDENGDPAKNPDGSTVYTDIVEYSVLINPAGEDLVQGVDFLTLWDHLEIGQAAGAEFLAESVALYAYDPTAPDHRGEKINTSLYAFTYDETEHVLTVQVPDMLPCVLVYQYRIDAGSAQAPTLKNKVYLHGDEEGTENEIKFQDTSSSASASKRDLTLYKVDATDYGARLAGAKFTLEGYIDGKWVLQTDKLVTGDDGKLVLSRTDEQQFENFNFQDNTLYRLTETKAPDGYASLLPSAAYHFVWVKLEPGQTLEQLKQAMIDAGKLGGVAAASVRFLTTSGQIYVPNEPTTLTVTKLWYDEDGKEITPPVESVKIRLVQKETRSNARTVTVHSKGNEQSWGSGQPTTRIVEVAEGSSLTIQVGGVWNNDKIYIKVGDASESLVAPGDGGICRYTIDNISDDLYITIRPEKLDNSQAYSEITFPDAKAPFFELISSKTYGEIDLKGKENWTYTWRDLPKTSENGARYYYSVEEVEAPPGFHVIYSMNNSDGVQAGELVVINQASGYVLPETGGPGTRKIAAAGALLLLLSAAGLLLRAARRRGAHRP